MVRNVTNVSITKNGDQQKIEVHTANRTYTAQSRSIYNLVYAEYYVSGGEKTSYRFYVNSTEAGRLSIGLTEYSSREKINVGSAEYLAIVYTVNLGG